MKREFYIAGVQFHDSDRVKDKMKMGDELTMRPEPTNEYDPNAVGLVYNNNKTEDDCFIGYVPAKISAEVAVALEISDEVICTLTYVAPDAKKWERFKVVITDEATTFKDEDNLKMGDY